MGGFYCDDLGLKVIICGFHANFIILFYFYCGSGTRCKLMRRTIDTQIIPIHPADVERK